MTKKVEIKWCRIDPTAVTPLQGNKDDAGYDIKALSRKIVIRNHTFYAVYGLGIGVDIPAGGHLDFRPRGSIGKYDLRLSNAVGLIDPAYKHEEMFARFEIILPHAVAESIYDLMLPRTDAAANSKFNPASPIEALGLSFDDRELTNANSVTYQLIMKYARIYNVGDRVIQAHIPNRRITWTEVPYVSPEDPRGGFGSTGS